MKTYDTTPTSEFLETYRRVTGSNDTSPRAVFGAMLDDELADKIRREHAEIMKANKDRRLLTKLDEREQFDPDIPIF